MIDPETLRRLKYLEEKISMFNNILQTIDVTTRSSLEDFKLEIENIKKEIKDIKQEINDLEIKIKAITDELSNFATIDQLKIINSILDYINPFDFVTKKELNKLVKEKIMEYLGDLYNQKS
jgi:predicted  nucleic acid-binding Zn-ribbon protein